MKLRDVVRSTLGACFVYLLVAACSGAEDSLSSEGSGGGHDGGVWDAVTDPVGDAQAGDPEVATEHCDKSFISGNTTFVYAEHSFAGRNLNDLGRAVAIRHDASGQTAFPPGYEHQLAGLWVAEGRVAAHCQSPTDTITFVLPRP